MANLRTNNLCGQGGRNALNGSVFFDGATGTGLQMQSSDFAFGTSDFNVEGWFWYAGDGASIASIWDSRTTDTTSGGFFVGINASGLFYTYGFPSGTGEATYKTIPPNSGWNHFSVSRSGNSGYVFLNGQQVGSTANMSSTNYTESGGVVGQPSNVFSSSLYRWKGYLSNIRVCIGHPIYTSNFTPPTSPLTAHFTNSSDRTALLCCQNSDDPTEDNSASVPGESLPKTILAFGGSFQTGSKNILKNADFSDGTTGFVGDSGASISASGGVMTVTNGGGDNLYALAQADVLRIGGKYRCTATVTPTFASGNPVFRVRFGGDAVSFTQQQSTMSTGVAVRIDTGEKVADGTRFEIGSGVSSGITQFTITDLVVTAIDPPIPPKIVPPFGTDNGVTFDGAIAMNSSSYMYFPTGRTEERGRGRAVIAGGVSHLLTPYMSRIDFLNIPTTGNSQFFGDLSFGSRGGAGAVSSTTRAIYAGGMGPASEVATNSMSFITIPTQGNGTDYGDLTATKRGGEGCSNGVRGLFMGGENDTPSTNTHNNVIDFCTIATAGDALDFGDLTEKRDGGGVCSSPIRGVCGGGFHTGNSDVIDFVTIATTGNATDFGNLTAARTQATGCASATRGLFMGGRIAPNNKSEIDFITIASTGNASDFGDLSEGRNQASATASQTRGVQIGGNNGSSPNNSNTMEFVTIASTGNTTDFGDTFQARTRGTTSDCHGGLS